MQRRATPSSPSSGGRARLVAAVVAAASLSCSGGGSKAGPSAPAVTLQPNAKVLDAPAAAAVTAYDFASGVVTLSALSGTLAGLAPGDVIVTAPGAATPHGFLRKVVSVAPIAGGGYAVQTTQARLDDAIKNGSLSEKVTLSSANAHVTALRQGVGFRRGTPTALHLTPPAGTEDSSGFDLPLNVTINENGNDVTVTGDVAFFAGIDFGVNIDVGCALDGKPCFGFKAVAELVDNASVSVDGTIQAQLSKSVEIASIAFDPITFFVGPVPVVLVPQLSVNLEFDGTAQVHFSYAAAAAGPQFAFGAQWDSSNGWQGVDQSSGPSFSSTAQNVSADLSVAAKIPVQFSIMLYDVAGPVFTLSFGLQAVYHLPRNPLWEIDGVVEADFGVKVSLPILGDLGDWEATLLQATAVIVSAPNTPPTIQIMAPANGSLVNVALPDNGLFYLNARTNDDEDGPNCCTVTWSTTPGGYTASGPVGTLTITTPGTYVLTATAVDSGGLSSSDQVTITVGGPQVNARFLLPGASCADRLWVNIPVTLEADPGPGLTGLPFDCTFTSDDPSDTQFPLFVDQTHLTNYLSCEPGSAGCCKAPTAFPTAGTRTLTLTVREYSGGNVIGSAVTQQTVTVTDGGSAPQPAFYEPGPTACAHRTLGELSGSLDVYTVNYGGVTSDTWTFQPPGPGCPPVPFTPQYHLPGVCLLGQVCPSWYTISGPTISALGTTACPAIGANGSYGTITLTGTDGTSTGSDFFWLALFNDTPPG